MGTNLRMSQVVGEVLPGVPAGVLTGPNLAREVAQGHPAACVVALADEELAVVGCRHSCIHARSVPTWAPMWWGCEIAGATKNVMAIAAGIGDGLGLGTTPGRPDHAGSGRTGTPWASRWAGRCSRSAGWPVSATWWRPAPARRAGIGQWGSRSGG